MSDFGLECGRTEKGLLKLDLTLSVRLSAEDETALRKWLTANPMPGEPITEKRLRDVGFTDKKYQRNSVLAIKVPCPIGDSQWLEVPKDCNYHIFTLCRWSDSCTTSTPPDRVLIGSVDTMSDLKNLCSALGITLNERRVSE